MVTGTAAQLNLPKVKEGIMPYDLNDAFHYLKEMGKREKTRWPAIIEEAGTRSFMDSDFVILSEALDHPDATIRFAMASIFAKINTQDDEMFQRFVRLLSDENPYVRIAAVMGICRFVRDEALNQLAIVASMDDDRSIRELARESGEALLGRMDLRDEMRQW